ncbi:dual specificity protein phosphatase 3-like [Apostichopus japonicus]|uniref:dual specificity protein phosphatase 3-like n=1 Tax=Stichopus japonicus TaxID=307972 RepID=UPI003AB426F4
MATKADNEVPLCTEKELSGILVEETGLYAMPSRTYDEITKGLFIGCRSPALNKSLLKKLGITHILNAAQGKKFMHVDTDADYYKDLNIKYLGLTCSDFESTNISKHFDTAADFIADGLNGDHKVLVHCVEGFSRSATLVIAYFMIKRGMTAQAAVGFVRASREIGPNDGFLRQICELNKKLHRQKGMENFEENIKLEAAVD